MLPFGSDTTPTPTPLGIIDGRRRGGVGVRGETDSRSGGAFLSRDSAQINLFLILAELPLESSSLERLQKIIAKAREDATQVKPSTLILRWAPPKRLAIVPWI